MKKIVYVLAALFLFACSADKNKIDSKYYKQVESDFNEVKKLASNRDDALFSVFNQNLSKEETRYLQFLYAYMPLSDLSDLSGDYFLKQVQTALEAKEYFSWGEIIPDDIFRHFVLPYRVNNEYPDTARQVFFRELKPRIENMNMYDAALEVNHWCHEKANYKATDRRTISPLDIVRSSFGRCGEESTFAVTALRAVGIPARQVYTPRWAHSDSNHAWVEVWIDGKWYFMGACEPEAQLNRGWFEAPAMRAMLVHTRVFGKLKNSENQMITNDKYSIINVIDTYIEPVDLIVKVIDENENLIQDAEISFGLYNYAQFYPIAVLTSDEKGECKMRTNHGSMLIYVQKDEKNAHSVFRVDEELETDTLILKLSDYQTKEYEEELYVEVPKERELKSPTSEDSINKIRLAQEDSIRNAYVESFPKDEEIEEFAQSISLNATEINEHIKMSWGNYDQIMEFIKIASEIDKNKCLKMLENLNEKDHRDARAVVLIDHFKNAKNLNYEDDFFAKYVMNPRISTEKMKAYRSYFLSEFDADFIKSCQENPSLIKNYIEERISIDEEWNFYGLATSPIGVHEIKIADPHTRNIYFVALCRSFNIPARLNPVTTVPEYYFNENWLEIGFEKEEVIETIKSAKLNLSSLNTDIQYYFDFSIAIFENGKFNTLNFGSGTPLSDLKEIDNLQAGYYSITSGKRLQNGDVLVWRKFFNLKDNETKNIEIKIRAESHANKLIGRFENFEPTDKSYCAYIWLDAKTEPGRHILNELQAEASRIDKADLTSIVYKCKNPDGDLSTGTYKMPETVEVKSISGDANFDNIKLDNSSSEFNLPVIILCNKNGEILYYQSGYRVGVIKQILDLVN